MSTQDIIHAAWRKVTKASPCLICEKADWCTEGEKGSCCMRVESQKMLGNGGWYHPFDSSVPVRAYAKRTRQEIKPTPPNFGALMTAWRGSSDPDKWQEMAENLGLPWASIWWLGATWATNRACMAFPMYEGANSTEDNPCGIRLRTMEGKKFAVTGSRSGLFIPFRAIGAYFTKFDLTRLFICEGPTDTIACLHMELFAIGRASCRGGEDAVIGMVNKFAAEVVIVSDNDGPGALGADILAERIQRPLFRLTTPSKDLREFIRNGGNRNVLESLIKNLIRK